MNDSIKKQLELIKEMATSKGYTLNVFERDTSQEKGVGSHYVDYAKKEIEIIIPLGHEEKDAILLHELIHAEFFLTGFPRILRSSEIQYDGLDLDLYQHIEDLSQHVLLYSKMNELKVMHDKENTKFLKNYLTNLFPDDQYTFVRNAFILTESFYRNPVEFLNYEPDIRKTHPNSDQLYRKLKRVLATIKSPLTARYAIIRMFDIVQEEFARCNFKYEFKEKCILQSVLLENQRQLFVSDLFQLVKRPKLKYIYLQEKRTGYYVRVLGSNIDFQKEKEFIKQVRCDKYWGLN
ncbi:MULTISPECIES: hypothetical protein [Bacillus cereus group]|uniref:hypothetical protein n=1 Tax=Bacillus cereus group TaxID=86661 RepID=UPI000CD9CB54|nr:MULTISPECIES: hypothetical protein [Bacillus cereus group]QFQ28927.1 hypothetical protein DDE73_30520 [Bacillus thuringiensis]